MMNLGSSIRIVRQKAYLTQEEFARFINVTMSTVNRWENNKVKPSYKAMKTIKQFCIQNEIEYEELESAWLNMGEINHA